MAPRWLPFNDEPGKRTSVLSVMSGARRTTYDDPDAVINAFAHPFFDQNSIHDALDAAEQSNSDKASSKKRRSFFARSSVATTDSEGDRPTLESGRSWPLFPFAEKRLAQASELNEAPQEEPRKPSRKSTILRSGKHEPILRWMRKVERSASTRPATPFGLGLRSPVAEDDPAERRQRPSISAPFNFQHVTHTQPRELPQLDTVTDRDLTLTFWASSANQTPQDELRGIKADKVEEVQRMSRAGSMVSESRPTSAGQNSTFSRNRSPSIPRDATIPMLRTSRSLSNASVQSMDDSRRPPAIPRTASLASLIAESRSPPTMVHPAFRSSQESSPQTPLSPWSASPGPQTPQTEVTRNLDVVLEEAEGMSPAKTAGFPAGATKSDHQTTQSATSTKDFHQSKSSSVCSDSQETSITSQGDVSVPSLSSGETWEEDVDFCYNMEAESTCDFQWRFGRHGFLSPSAHDSVLSAPRKPLLHVSPYDVSPRVSIAQHQRNRSSMTMTPWLSSPFAESHWDPISAFENPRVAPAAPLPEIHRLSSLLDLPMLRTPRSEAEATSPGKASDHTVTEFRSSQSFSPEKLTAALRRSIINSNIEEADDSNASPVDQAQPAIEFGRAPSADPKTEVRVLTTSTGPRPSTAPSQSHQPIVKPAVRPVSHAGAPSPPPTVPLPPIPQDLKTIDSSLLNKRATLAGAPQVETIMRRPSSREARYILQAAGRKVQTSRTVSSPRLAHSQSVEQFSPREAMKRTRSSPTVHDLYHAHAVPKMAEKFPVWI